MWVWYSLRLVERAKIIKKRPGKTQSFKKCSWPWSLNRTKSNVLILSEKYNLIKSCFYSFAPMRLNGGWFVLGNMLVINGVFFDIERIIVCVRTLWWSMSVYVDDVKYITEVLWREYIFPNKSSRQNMACSKVNFNSLARNDKKFLFHTFKLLRRWKCMKMIFF